MNKFLSSRIVRTKRPPPLLVCRKCLKRADSGKAIARALKSELKAHAKADALVGSAESVASESAKKKKTKRAKLVFTSCFGLCPKNAVVTATAEQLAKGEVGLVGHPVTDL